MVQMLRYPSGYNAYKFFSVIAETVVGAGNFNNHDICLKRRTVSETVSYIRIGQMISKTVDNQYGLRNTANVFVGIGYGFRAPKAYNMVGGIKRFAQRPQIDQYPLIAFAFRYQILGLAEDTFCCLRPEYTDIPLKQIARRTG